MEPVRKWAFTAVMILHDAEAVRLGTMREFVARDGMAYRQRKICQHLIDLMYGFDTIKDCTGTIQTIYDAANAAGVDVLNKLRASKE